MLRADKKPDAKQAIEWMDDETFVYFIAELYARQGATVYLPDATQGNNYDLIVEDTRFTPYGEEDVTAVKCKHITAEELEFHHLESALEPELRDEFDYYVVCSTAKSLSRLARQKLAGKGYEDNWLDLQNFDFIVERMMEPHSAYLPLVYNEVSPADYENGWEDNQYIKDRLTYLGVSADEHLLPKIQAADDLILYLEHAEKFGLLKSLGATESIYEHMQYAGHRPPEMLQEITRWVNIEKTTPNEELFSIEEF